MRKLFAFNMISLDGFFEGPEHDISWHNVDEEFNQFAIEQLQATGALIFGRITYEMMASYWPTPLATTDDPVVASLMNNTPKLVFSKTLQKAEWENTTLLKGDLAEEIAKLKQQPGKDIAVFGSADLLASLINLDLVDEHRVMVNPVVLGIGTPLFKNLDRQLSLKLLDSRRFNSGNVLLYYAPDRA